MDSRGIFDNTSTILIYSFSIYFLTIKRLLLQKFFISKKNIAISTLTNINQKEKVNNSTFENHKTPPINKIIYDKNFMSKFIFYIPIIIISICCISSCKTKKNLTYLRDLENQEEQVGIPAPTTIYKIKSSDNLYIDIQTMNPEINALFNPSKGSGYQSGTQQNFGDLSSQYLNGFMVDKGGYVKLPIIGKIKVENKTLSEAEELIQNKAYEYLKDATVKVKLLNFKITVLGEVNNPGVYFNYNEYFTILDGISMASGETDYSQISNVKVLRTTEHGSKSYILDLTKKNFLTSEAYYLQPNDVIYVEPAGAKSRQINTPLYSLVLSSVSTIVLLLNFIK